jgi:hypothetical protein
MKFDSDCAVDSGRSRTVSRYNMYIIYFNTEEWAVSTNIYEF